MLLGGPIYLETFYITLVKKDTNYKGRDRGNAPEMDTGRGGSLLVKVHIQKATFKLKPLPFHLEITASRSDRMLGTTWAKTGASKWPAAGDPIWTLLALNKTGFILGNKV